MEILSTTTWTLSYLDAAKHEAGKTRSPGLHVSDVLRHIDNEVVHPGERRPYGELTRLEKRNMGYRVEMGFIFEAMVDLEFKARMKQRAKNKYRGVLLQAEISLDGIYLTPDCYVQDTCTVDEYKATWTTSKRWSDRDPEASYWYWFASTMCYCFAHGTNLCDFYVFWVNGDYAGMGPNVQRYSLYYSDEELESNWRMVLKHAPEVRRRLYGGV